jgi:hypothetical protein
MMYEAGRDSRLNNSMCDVVSEIDGDGLENSDESSEGSGSDSSHSSWDGGSGIHFRDLEALSELSNLKR